MRRKPTDAGAGAKPLTWNVDEITMKVPSRRMPAAPVPKTPVGSWLFLAALLAGLIGWIWRQPYLVGVLLAVFGVCVGIQLVWDTRSRRRLAVARQGESICEFARSFDRSADTWVIRAVYEEISRHLSVDGRAVPVRRQDQCVKELLSAVTQKGPPRVEIGGFKITHPLSTGRLRRNGPFGHTRCRHGQRAQRASSELHRSIGGGGMANPAHFPPSRAGSKDHPALPAASAGSGRTSAGSKITQHFDPRGGSWVAAKVTHHFDPRE